MDKYSLAFSVSNLGPKSFQKLFNKFGDAESAWKGSRKEFLELDIVGLTYKKFDEFRKQFDQELYIKKLKKEDVEFIDFGNIKYPKSFKKLENPPIGIFCKGNVSLLKSNLKIAVVGTRKITNYGNSVTESIVSDLVSYGAGIVSGLALGVDGLSHRVCLENNGATIAVMPCGVDCCRPAENYSLYKRILENNGLIISEYPLSLSPNKGTFLARNRLIASLSDGVLVTEAAEDSGSLVTAEWGFKLSKKVFAVPGPINSQMAKGSLKLLKQGAKLVTEGEDILSEFVQYKNKKSKMKKENLKKFSKDEQKIIKLLENEEMSVDELFVRTNIQISQLFTILTKFELLGIVKNASGIFTLR